MAASCPESAGSPQSPSEQLSLAGYRPRLAGGRGPAGHLGLSEPFPSAGSPSPRGSGLIPTGASTSDPAAAGSPGSSGEEALSPTIVPGYRSGRPGIAGVLQGARGASPVPTPLPFLTSAARSLALRPEPGSPCPNLGAQRRCPSHLPPVRLCNTRRAISSP